MGKKNGWTKVVKRELRRVPNLPESDDPNYWASYKRGERLMERAQEERPRNWLRKFLEDLEKNKLILSLAFVYFVVDFTWMYHIIYSALSKICT